MVTWDFNEVRLVRNLVMGRVLVNFVGSEFIAVELCVCELGQDEIGVFCLDTGC